MLLQWCKAKATQTNRYFQAYMGLWYCICIFYLISRVYLKDSQEVGSRVATDDIYLTPWYGVWFLCMIFFCCLSMQISFLLNCLFFLRFSALYKLQREFQPCLKMGWRSTNAKWQRHHTAFVKGPCYAHFWTCFVMWTHLELYYLRKYKQSWIGLHNKWDFIRSW